MGATLVPMTIRIPSSLKWLINKHARLASQIESTQSVLDKSKELYLEMVWENRRAEENHALLVECNRRHLAQLQKDLAAIASTLLLHDIPIDPEIIAPIKTQQKVRHFPHGEITRLIFEVLKLAKGQPKSTTEIFIFIRAHSPKIMSAADDEALRISVRKRLKTLHAEQKVELFGRTLRGQEGRWVLAREL